VALRTMDFFSRCGEHWQYRVAWNSPGGRQLSRLCGSLRSSVADSWLVQQLRASSQTRNSFNRRTCRTSGARASPRSTFALRDVSSGREPRPDAPKKRRYLPKACTTQVLGSRGGGRLVRTGAVDDDLDVIATVRRSVT
jgi:hypothetical protein